MHHWTISSAVLTALLLISAGCASTNESTAERDRPTGSGFSMTDARIALSVKAKLTAERAANLVSVNVRSRDAVVYLDGNVPTQEDKERAESIARTVDGVRDVFNDLVIRTAGR